MHRLLGCLLLCAGCATSTHTLPPASPAAYSALNRMVEGERVTVHFADGHTRIGHGLVLAPDTTIFDVLDGQAHQKVPTCSIRSIETGPARNFDVMVGTGTLFTGVGMMAFAVKESNSYRLASGLGVALIGGAITVVSGVFGTKRHHYRLPACRE